MASRLDSNVPEIQPDAAILDFLDTYLKAYRLSSSSSLWTYALYALLVVTVLLLAIKRQRKMSWELKRLRLGITFDHSALRMDGSRDADVRGGGRNDGSDVDMLPSKPTLGTRLRARWIIPRPRPRKIRSSGLVGKLRTTLAAMSPPRGQVILIVIFVLVTLLLSFVGPDAINQDRQALQALTDAISPVSYESDGEGLVLGGAYTSPQIVNGALSAGNVDKQWWTIGNRSGLLAFANFPLLILLVVRTPGLNIIQAIGRVRSLDLNTCHRWVGRLILILSTVHVAMWSIKASGDQVLRYGLSPDDAQGITITGRTRLINVLLLWSSFRWGLIAYGALILLHVLAFSPTMLRPKIYELFHALHAVLALVFFIACWLHYPPLMIWVAISLGIWVVERIGRSVWVMFNNRSQKEVFIQHVDQNGSISEKGTDSVDLFKQQGFFNLSTAANSEYSLLQKSDSSHIYPPPLESQQTVRASGYGFDAHIQALPGRTMRVTIPVGRRIKGWTAGQHIWICFPTLPTKKGGVSRLGRLEWHPFSIASTPGTSQAWQHEETGQDERLSDEKVVLIIRARAGMTDRLYSWTKKTLLQQGPLVSGRREDIGSTAAKPQPARLRVLLEPTPAIIRSHYEHHDISLIICGGSGVSFGISVLGSLVEALKTDAMSMSKMAAQTATREKVAKNDTSDRVSRTRHVRFVWIIQDASHLSWVARPLQYFLSMVPDKWLTVEVYVTQGNTVEKHSYESKSHLGFGQDEGDFSARTSQDLATFEGETDGVAASELNLAKFQAGQPSPFSRAPDRESMPSRPVRNASEVTLHAVFQKASSQSQPRTSSMTPALTRPPLSVVGSPSAGWQNLASEISMRRDGVMSGYNPSQESVGRQSERTIRTLRSSQPQSHIRTDSTTNRAHLSAPANISRSSRDNLRKLSETHSRLNSASGFALAAPFEQQSRSGNDSFLADTLRVGNGSNTSFFGSPLNPLSTPASPRKKRERDHPSSYALHPNVSSDTVLPMSWEELEARDQSASASASASLLSPQRAMSSFSLYPASATSTRMSSTIAAPANIHTNALQEQAALLNLTQGKPDLERIVFELLYTLRTLQSPSLGVVVCGPISLDAEVRHTVSQAMKTTSTAIDFIAQEFTW